MLIKKISKNSRSLKYLISPKKTYSLPEREHTKDDGVLDYCAEYAEDADDNVPGQM